MGLETPLCCYCAATAPGCGGETHRRGGWAGLEKQVKGVRKAGLGVEKDGRGGGGGGVENRFSARGGHGKNGAREKTIADRFRC